MLTSVVGKQFATPTCSFPFFPFFFLNKNQKYKIQFLPSFCSEEVNERPPSFYDAPRASIGSAPPLPTSRALKPPKVPRPYSEPNRKLKRNSLTHVKNLPIPVSLKLKYIERVFHFPRICVTRI